MTFVRAVVSIYHYRVFFGLKEKEEEKVKLFLSLQKEKKNEPNMTLKRTYSYMHRHRKKINSCYKLAFIVVDDDVRSSRYFSATTAYA